MLKKLFFDESGQALSEYSLLLGIIVVGVVAVVVTLKDKIVSLFNDITSALGS